MKQRRLDSLDRDEQIDFDPVIGYPFAVVSSQTVPARFIMSRQFTIALFLIVATLATLPGCKNKESGNLFNESGRKGTAEAPVKDIPKDMLATQQAFINLVKEVTPSVVNISTVSKKKMERPLFEVSPFGDFFGGGMPRGPQFKRDKSLGSGFIINKEGYIVTNDHVVRDAESIQVKLSNDQIYNAKVVGSDQKTDLAVIKIDSKEPLQVAAVLGDSDKLQVGQWAIAIGNPFGLDRTVTVGVISATGRSGMGIETYEDFIQTDASINPGNSGGPLLNIHGEVIGINTAIVAAGQGIGFAIPVNMAKNVVSQLMQKGKVSRGWLGVSIQPVTAALAESFGLKKASGALISDVMANSPAAKSGIRQGDVITRFDGKDIKDSKQLQLIVADTPANKSLKVELIRDGKPLALTVIIGNADNATTAANRPESVPVDNWLGLSVEELPQNQQGRGVTGVLVTGVEQGSTAAEGGVRPSDIIQAVNQRRILNLGEYAAVMQQAAQRGAVALLVRRGNMSLYFAFNMR
jgi:Do/DeqQ family serine protease